MREMSSGTELDALEWVNKEGGEASASTIAYKMRLEPSYTRMILTSLARKDYLDLIQSGKFVITAKGRMELKERDRLEPEEENKGEVKEGAFDWDGISVKDRLARRRRKSAGLYRRACRHHLIRVEVAVGFPVQQSLERPAHGRHARGSPH